MTTCANPACHNPLPARAYTGRPPIYCSPACRPARRRPPTADTATANTATTADTATADTAATAATGTATITVELDHPTTSPDGRPPERVWTVRLRRGQRQVVIAEGLGWPTAAALARQLDDLLCADATNSAKRPGQLSAMGDHDAAPEHRQAASSYRVDDPCVGPDDRCSCGRPAVIVYLTEHFGRVGFCGIPDAQPLPGHAGNEATDTP